LIRFILLISPHDIFPLKGRALIRPYPAMKKNKKGETCVSPFLKSKFQITS
jgi:hypothetical protein